MVSAELNTRMSSEHTIKSNSVCMYLHSTNGMYPVQTHIDVAWECLMNIPIQRLQQ